MLDNAAIFLDRDGTINPYENYPHKISDLSFLPGVIGGLKQLQPEYKLIIVTNQSGIGRGYYTVEDYQAFRQEMHKRLGKQGVSITAEYFCPHQPKDNCSCRKPRIGMLEQAQKDFDLDFNQCWMIGDSVTDIQAGRRAECKTVYLLTGKQETILPYSADFTAKDLLEAAEYILNMITHKN